MLDQGALCLELLKDFRYDQISFHASVRIIAGILWADGKLDKYEVKFIENLSHDGFASLKKTVWKHEIWDDKEALANESHKIKNPRLRFLLFDLLFFAAYSDGKIADEQTEYLTNYLNAIGIEDDELNQNLIEYRLKWFEHLKESIILQRKSDEYNTAASEMVSEYFQKQLELQGNGEDRVPGNSY
ncbi:hypothetical protein ACFL35_16515 [Candidatus Riflebacteria bacterium]